MRIAVLGTGMVGRAHAARLSGLGHQVTLGTRDPTATAGDIDQWRAKHADVAMAAYATACSEADLALNALNGSVAVEVLSALAEPLAGKVLIDISNPLDFSSGHLELFVCNTDSLGEQIQRAVPDTHVVKTLCTVTADVQVDPSVLGAPTDMFLAGNDADAKGLATDVVRFYGWERTVDLGDLTAARALEMMLPLWLRIYQSLGTALFNYRVTSLGAVSSS